MTDKNNFIDPELAQELQETKNEELLTEYGTPRGGEIAEKLNFLSDWAPQQAEWEGKTTISPRQARNMAAALYLPEIYPELDDRLDGWYKDLLNSYMMLLTSIEGTARDQHVNVMRAMFGGDTQADEEIKSAMLQTFAKRSESENE